MIERLVDGHTFFEIKERYAQEIVVGLARLEGVCVGLVATQPKVKGGAIFVDSADKAARFVMLCDAFNIPLIFLLDVPGFMIGSQVERQGIIRHGAKMISAMASAAVPRFCVVLRKAYAAGYYAMCSPGFEPRATLALPYRFDRCDGAGSGGERCHAKRIAAIADPDDRAAFVAARKTEYAADLDLIRVASDLPIDAVVEPAELRSELAKRLRAANGWRRQDPGKHRAVLPV